MPAAFEEILAFILAQLRDPSQHEEEGAILILDGEPCEVVVRLTAEDVLIAEYGASPSAVGTVRWSGISEDHALRAIKALLNGAREARRSRYTICASCERPTPPELMADEELCRQCSHPQGGTVH